MIINLHNFPCAGLKGQVLPPVWPPATSQVDCCSWRFNPSTLEFYPFCQPLTDIQVRAARIDGIDFKFRSHSRLCESQLNLD